MSWDPHQYLKFSEPRTRPALDLLARVPVEDPALVYDLGCGAGHLTRILARRWPQARVVGVDNSAAMLAAAAQEASRITWSRCEVGAWHPDEAAHVIYSNAALHWIANHEELFPALIRRVAVGGILAVQMPRNFSAPSHTLIAETARSRAWLATLQPLLRSEPVAEPSFYHALLAPLTQSLDIWETEYLHVLTGEDPVKEWLKGTWLKPFLDRLEEPDRGEFEADYAMRLRAAYPRRPDGTTLLPFRRLFIMAQR